MNEFVFISQIPFQKSICCPSWGGGGGAVLYYHNAATLIAGTYNASKYIYTSTLSKQRAG